jgi:hypothetical protein
MSLIIQLMSTKGCHLCDEAKKLYDVCLQEDPEWSALFSLVMIDIADNEYTLHKYGLRIPVLKCQTQELEWVFNRSQLRHWLTSLISHPIKNIQLSPVINE